jgi:predicted negative regulator of RcsB-dependent stress response
VTGVTSRTEEEELAAIKEWWQRNGKPLLVGGALALVGVFGWQAWQNHQANQSYAASALYQQLVDVTLSAPGEPDAGKVSDLAGKLNKVIADDLKVCMRTVEVHRASLFEKMGVKTAVELARIIAETPGKPAN